MLGRLVSLNADPFEQFPPGRWGRPVQVVFPVRCRRLDEKAGGPGEPRCGGAWHIRAGLLSLFVVPMQGAATSASLMENPSRCREPASRRPYRSSDRWPGEAAPALMRWVSTGWIGLRAFGCGFAFSA